MPHSVSIWSSSPTTTCSCASAQHRRHTSRKYDRRAGSAGIFGVRLRIDGCHVGSTDLGVVVEVLVQALAGPGADDLDLDVLVGAVAGEADHLAGELDDLHRLAHVEHEHLALVGHRAGLQHEADGFGDGHEVAGHLGVGDRDRPALDDLAEERGHHAAAAAEHVAEAHRGERQLRTRCRSTAPRARRRACSRP